MAWSLIHRDVNRRWKRSWISSIWHRVLEIYFIIAKSCRSSCCVFVFFFFVLLFLFCFDLVISPNPAAFLVIVFFFFFFLKRHIFLMWNSNDENQNWTKHFNVSLTTATSKNMTLLFLLHIAFFCVLHFYKPSIVFCPTCRHLAIQHNCISSYY